MPDEISNANQEQDSGNDDPEVPVVHGVRATHHHEGSSELATRVTAYLHRSSEGLRIAANWVWKNRPGAQVWSAIAALLSLLSALSACYLVYYSREQWKFLSDQVYLAGDSERASRMAQRAYVDVPQQLQVRMVKENGRVTAWIPEITMINNGDTGTYNTGEVVNDYAFPSQPASEACDFPDNGKPQHSDIGPHESEVFDAPRLSIAAIQSVKNGGHVYISGSVWYRDVFQFYGLTKHGQTRHLREFCYELRLDSAEGDLTSPSYVPPKSLVLYGSRNCTDGDCDDYYRRIHTQP